MNVAQNSMHEVPDFPTPNSQETTAAELLIFIMKQLLVVEYEVEGYLSMHNVPRCRLNRVLWRGFCKMTFLFRCWQTSED